MFWQLIWSFLKIGMVSIGGGYAIIPLIQEQVVHGFQWLTLQEYSDMITISQMTPGPLVVNMASFVGVRLAGVPGAIFATIASVLSGFILSIVLYRFFQRHSGISYVANVLNGLRSSSTGLIASAAGSILVLAFFGTAGTVSMSVLNPLAVVMFVIALYILRRFRPNPLFAILGSGLVGLVVYGLG